ncbi:MAG: porin [Chitinophagales bacterium]
MKISTLLFFIISLSALKINAQTTEAEKFIPSIKWQLIMQNRFEASLTDSMDVQNKYSADPTKVNFRIRRMAIRTDISLTNKLTGVVRVQLPELKMATTPGKAIELAYANYKFSDGFQIRAGQFLVPFVLDEFTPYDNLRMIDRGPNSILFVNSNLASYQPGIMFLGNLLNDKTPLGYFIGVVNGSDRSVPYDNNSAKNIFARIEFTPVKGIKLGVADQMIGLYDESGNAYSADLSISKKISSKTLLLIEGEYLTGTNVSAYSADTSSTKEIADFNMGGYQGLVLLKFETEKKWCKMFEVGGKFEQTDPNMSVDNNGFSTITGDIAFNFLEENKARLQLNIIHTTWESTITAASDIAAADMFVMQFQIKI